MRDYKQIAYELLDDESKTYIKDPIEVEKTTEDMEKMAAIVPSDKPYMKTTVFETYKKRIPWLLLLMVSATFTGAILKTFESALSV